MYYLFAANSRPRRRIRSTPYIKGVDWWKGDVITTAMPLRLQIDLKPYIMESPDHDQYMAAIMETNPPLWRDDLIDALRACGVHNFDCYDVEINDPDNGQVMTNYKAVNVLGLVAAANMEKSVATIHDGIPLIDVDFDQLVVDEKKTQGIKLFRLAESSNAILVHEHLRDCLLEKGFGSDIAFYNLDEAAI